MVPYLAFCQTRILDWFSKEFERALECFLLNLLGWSMKLRFALKVLLKRSHIQKEFPEKKEGVVGVEYFAYSELG